MASSGSVNSSSYSNWYLQLNWTQTAKDSVTNKSTISWNVKTIRSSGSGSYYVGNISAVINGTTVYSCDNSNRWLMSDGATVASGTTTITHNNDGTKTFTASIKGAIYTYADNVSGSKSFTLDTIPRYASISQSLSSRTETSLTVAWTADATCDYLWYSTDNGSNWTGVTIGSATSGNYTITGLTANTAYNVKTRVRRKDSQLNSDSSATSMSTYAYPYANSMPNFTLGNSVTIGIFNPLGRSVTVALLDKNGTQVGSLSTSGTSVSGFNGSTAVDALYASIPNAQSANYKVKVTYSSQTTTKTGGTYTVKESDCAPVIGSVSYADTNATVQAIISDTSKIVQNLSTVQYTASSLSAKKSATLSSVSVAVNGNTYSLTISGSSASGGNAVVNSGQNVTAVFTLTDSRGLTVTKSVTVTMLAWALPTAIVSVQRESNFYSLTNLLVDASFSSVDSKNTITISYTGVAVPQTGKTTPSNVTGTLSDNVTSQASFDNEFEWNITILLVDRFGGTKSYTTHISRGMPLTFFDRKRLSVGINMFPQHDGSFEIDGDIYADDINVNDVNADGVIVTQHGNAGTNALVRAKRTDTNTSVWVGVGSAGVNHGVYSDKLGKWMLYGDASRTHINVDAIYPVGSIYMSVSNTSPATYFGGTWEQIKDTFLLACGSTYANGATGGEASHTLTTDEMPSHDHFQQYQSDTSYVGIHVKNYNTGGSIQGVQPANGTRRNNIMAPAVRVATVASGGGQAHNNMPPYLAVYVWKRTA